MSNQGLITGELERDSPQFYGATNRFLGKNAVIRISEVYKIAISDNAHLEDKVERARGVSFNPYPSRIGTILILDADVRDSDLVASSIFATIKNSEITSKYALPREQEFCLDLKSFPAFKIKGTALIEAAILLDNMRHLHMRSINLDEINLTLNRSFQLLDLQLIEPSKLQNLLLSTTKRIQDNFLS